MKQLHIEYDKNFMFLLKCKGIIIGRISYEYHSDEIKHLIYIVSSFEKFKKHIDDEIEMEISWNNDSCAGINLSYENNEICLNVYSYEQSRVMWIIPIINKSEVIDDIDKIIESMKKEIDIKSKIREKMFNSTCK